MRKEFRNPQSALTMLLELPVGLAQESDFAKEDVRLFAASQRLAVEFRKFWFVIERINLRQATAQTEMHRTPRLGSKVRRLIGCLAGNGIAVQSAIASQK